MEHAQLQRITDLGDPALDDYLRMTDVRLRSRVEVERGLFMAESYEVISRAVDAGMEPRSFLMSEKWKDKFAPLYEQFPEVPVYVGDGDLIEQFTGFHLHRGALASMQRPVLPEVAEVLRTARTVAVIEDIVDHTNVGALFRSAAALGVDAVLVTPQCADPLYRRSIRVSMGTVFQVPWTRLEAWPRDGVELLHEAGFDVLALALTDGAVALEHLDLGPDRKVAFVLGAEGHGLKPATLAAVDQHVVIPMAGGVDSLNVAAASAVVFWQRRAALIASGAPAG
ncbi:MAG: TrmH family RNA methyltransferase [Brachybacterium tyrofermentans]|uniref:TrmH family RNA methyltransferase n=1 Tax=Brachybacterium tyrofermentans TaxID=47848 RepID=A0ABW0FJU8_9MICO|nr:RNA methyltransferase [Brachybacterium tyrofermentans]SLN04765.1 COG0566: rRNA methylases [Corynebacterium xerosis]